MQIDLKEYLEGLYCSYNRREFVHPDPLEFLYRYSNPLDREIVGLIASSLAYGRVNQILKSVEGVLQYIPMPHNDLLAMDYLDLKAVFSGFKHRFTTGDDLAAMLFGIKKVIQEYGSIEEAFMALHDANDPDLVPTLSRFVRLVWKQADCSGHFLLPSPENGSACKRAFLFLRWMVRCDAVDPGGWRIPASKLVVPMDTHMHRIARGLGLTHRKQADLKAALEVTEAFRRISPQDPVRYDFCLTRFGIHPDMDYSMLKCAV